VGRLRPIPVISGLCRQGLQTVLNRTYDKIFFGNMAKMYMSSYDRPAANPTFDTAQNRLD